MRVHGFGACEPEEDVISRGEAGHSRGDSSGAWSSLGLK